MMMVVGWEAVCYALLVQLMLFIVAVIYSWLLGVAWVLGVVLSPDRQSVPQRNDHLNIRTANQERGESFTCFAKIDHLESCN